MLVAWIILGLLWVGWIIAGIAVARLLSDFIHTP